MRKSVSFILVFFSLFSISISYADECRKACNAIVKPNIDKTIPVQQEFFWTYCSLRCQDPSFTCRSNPILEDVENLKNDSNWLAKCRNENYYKDLAQEREKRRTIKRAQTQEIIRENDRKHQETMAAIRNQQNQAAAAQASTQTSQNNYPSDSTSGQSRPDSSARHDNTNYGNCISVTSEKNRYVVYKNNCSENLTLLLCQVSDGQGSEDNYSRFQDGGSCPSPGFGAIDIRAGATHKKAEWFDFNNYRFFYYACKTGWIPVNESGKHVTRINESFLCKN